MSEALKIRLVSFGYTFGAILIGAVGAALLSPEFSALIKEVFKNSPALAGFVLLILPELVKAIRNELVTRKLGSTNQRPFLI